MLCVLCITQWDSGHRYSQCTSSVNVDRFVTSPSFFFFCSARKQLIWVCEVNIHFMHMKSFTTMTWNGWINSATCTKRVNVTSKLDLVLGVDFCLQKLHKTQSVQFYLPADRQARDRTTKTKSVNLLMISRHQFDSLSPFYMQTKTWILWLILIHKSKHPEHFLNCC